MSRRKSRRNEERRQRVMVALVKLSLVVGAFGLTSYYAYEVGYRVAQGEVGNLKAELQKAADDAQAQDAKLDADRTAFAEVRKEADDYKALYEQVKPRDELKEVNAAVRAKVGEGMDPHRLAIAIKLARNPHDCEMLGPKRFLVRTPRYRGPTETTLVRFDDQVSISADGVGGNGGHEQWFDPERPLKVRVAASGAKNAELAGTLPLEHAVAVRNSEYHFTMTAGPRGWVEVVTERCNFR